MMNYIGSKLSLLGFLDESISKVAGDGSKTFCDLFAGTGAVGVYFKNKGLEVTSNDIQYYSYVLNRHYVGNHKPLKFLKLAGEISGLAKAKTSDRPDQVCQYLEELPGRRGFIYNNYCLGGTADSSQPRQYFSDANGQKCDAIRQKIEEWRAASLVTDDEYYFLLATLLEAIDKCANTASVYGAFLKSLKKSAQKPLSLKPAKLLVNDQEHKVFNQDINQLLENVSGDILYLDPPYNQRQYATNYHLLETIAKYDNPKVHGKTGLRDYQDQKSLYCSRRDVKAAFADLIARAKAKYIFLSYNDEGLMTLDDIKQIMETRGRYGYFTKSYNRFRADRDENRRYKSAKTTEYLHYVICDS